MKNKFILGALSILTVLNCIIPVYANNNIDLSYSLAETEGEIIFHLDSTSIVYDDDKLEDSIKYHITTNAGNYYLDNEEAKTVPYFVEAKHTKLSDERGGNEEIPVTFNWENAKGTLDLTKTVSDNTTYAGQIDTTITKANSAGQYLGKTIVLFNEHARVVTPGSCFTYEDNETGGITITGYDDACGAEVVIPEKIDGKTVTELGDSAFLFNQTVTSLVLPDSMKIIRGSAIYMTSLTEIVLNEGLETIEAYGIAMSDITELSIPSTVTTLENSSIIDNNYLEVIYDNTNKEFDWISIINSTSAQLQYKTPVDIKQTATRKEIRLLNDWYVTLNGTEATVYNYRNRTNTGSVIVPSTFGEYTVTSIGTEAFKNTKVTNIIIPSTVTSLAEKAFYGSKITEIEIPGSITIIPKQAFSYVSTLTDVTLNEGLETIAYNAFSDTSIETITIPSTVTTIENGAFNYTDNLTTIVNKTGKSFNWGQIVDSLGGKKEFITGVIPAEGIKVVMPGDWSYVDNSTGITITAYTGNDTIVNIPSTIEGKPVTTIGQYAFSWTNVQSIELPSTVTTIDYGAFRNIETLTNVTLNEGLKTISPYAFAETSITSITIPSTVTNISSFALINMNELELVINGTMGKFDWNKAITGSSGSKFISGTVEITDADTNTTRTITIEAPSCFTYIENDTGLTITSVKNNSNCYQTWTSTNSETGTSELRTTVSFPSEIDGKPVTELGDGENPVLSDNITDINVPSTVKKINSNAFPGLQQVSFAEEGLEYIGKKAFYNSRIELLEIPATVKTIDEEAFAYSEDLTHLWVWYDGLETIEDRAFYGCSSLEKVILPSTVTSIGASAFEGSSPTKIVNKTGKAFDWNLILEGGNGTNNTEPFVTGTYIKENLDEITIASS